MLAALLLGGGIVGGTALIYAPGETDGAQVAAAAAADSKPNPFVNVSLTAQSAFVYDTKTNTVLFAKNAETPMALASVTKLMLATVVSEVMKPDDIVTITPTAIAQEGDSGLLDNEHWRMQDLMDFTLIMSSNDGAEALAEAAAPRIKAKYPQAPTDTPAAATIWRMNQKAKELGLTQTFYLDSNGLDSSLTMGGAYGSAKDMGLLMSYIIAHHLSSVSATRNATETFTSLSGFTHTAYTTNDALSEIPGLIAGKTGYTDLAGGNLVVAYDATIGHPLVAVVLGSTHDARFSDIQTLVNASRQAIAIGD